MTKILINATSHILEQLSILQCTLSSMLIFIVPVRLFLHCHSVHFLFQMIVFQAAYTLYVPLFIPSRLLSFYCRLTCIVCHLTQTEILLKLVSYAGLASLACRGVAMPGVKFLIGYPRPIWISQATIPSLSFPRLWLMSFLDKDTPT